MIKIHVTKKLMAKLPVDDRGFLPSKDDYPASGEGMLYSQESLLSGWHANLLTIARRNCVLFVHDKTRFALFIPMLTKPDFANLDRHFQDVLMNALLKAGGEADLIEAAAEQLQPLAFDTMTDRSVQGTMNQMKADLVHKLFYDDEKIEALLPYSTSVWLSDRPCTGKGEKDCIWPLKAMPALLSVGELQSPLQAVMEEPHLADVIQFSDYQK